MLAQGRSSDPLHYLSDQARAGYSSFDPLARWSEILEELKIEQLVFVSLLISGANAQDFPSRPIRVVVPYSAERSSDGPMRVIAQEMSKQLGQQMVVENKPGQGAMLGSAEVVKAAPDGYTLLLASNPNAISPALYRRHHSPS